MRARRPGRRSRLYRPGRLERVLPGHGQDHRRLQADRREAVHPVYGFLSENATFSRRLEEEGIKSSARSTIGSQDGDKIESKKLAIAAQVNTIPVITMPSPVRRSRQAIARKGIGYPVMIKASAGGGRQGLARRTSTTPKRTEGFTPLPSTEAPQHSWRRPRLSIEKYVLEPRHIEIQVWATRTATTST